MLRNTPLTSEDQVCGKRCGWPRDKGRSRRVSEKPPGRAVGVGVAGAARAAPLFIITPRPLINAWAS